MLVNILLEKELKGVGRYHRWLLHMAKVEAVIWDGRNARDRTSMGSPLEPAGGSRTDEWFVEGARTTVRGEYDLSP